MERNKLIFYNKFTQSQHNKSWFSLDRKYLVTNEQKCHWPQWCHICKENILRQHYGFNNFIFYLDAFKTNPNATRAVLNEWHFL